MQHSVNISIFIIFFIFLHIAHLSAGYRKSMAGRGDWEPKAPVAPTPVEPVEVSYSLVAAPLAQGGALHWDAAQNVLFFADISAQTLYRYDPATKVQKSIKLGGAVSLVIPLKGQKHHMVVSASGELSILKWYWDSGDYNITHLASVNTAKIRSHWGAGRADEEGRIWAESSNIGDRRLEIKASAGLYSVDTVKSCRIDSKYSDDDVNGLAWSPDNKILYYSSPSRKILAFDFNVDTGSIGSPQTIFDYGDLPGSPAGLAVNQNGDLWIASFGGSQIIKINPTSGRILRKIKLPVKQVTSIVFGGANLEDLYVASAGTDTGDESGLQGAVIKIVDLKETGLPMYPTDILCKPCNDKKAADSSSWWCTAGNDGI